MIDTEVAELHPSSVHHRPGGDNRVAIKEWGTKDGRHVAFFRFLSEHHGTGEDDEPTAWEYAYHLYCQPN